MQIFGTCLAAGALAAKVARIMVIVVAAVLVAGSIATSLSRPEPKPIVRDGLENDPETITTTTGDSTLVTLDEATEPGTPTPSAADGPEVSVESVIWNNATGAWAKPEASTAFSAGYEQGSPVPVLVRLAGMVPGAHYRVETDYGDCGADHTDAFDGLATPVSAGPIPWLTSPAPGRERPDAITSAPTELSGGHTVPVLAWGAAFSAEAKAAHEPGRCRAPLVLELVARADTVSLAFAGRLAPENVSGTAGFAPVTVTIEPS